MSDSNIGAQQDKNIMNHLFVIYGIINSVIKGKEKCIDLQIYDLEQAFDALWLEDCMIDLYLSCDKKEQDDKLALMYELNQNNLVAVNTPVGQTNRINIQNIVMQGSTPGPLQLSLIHI